MYAFLGSVFALTTVLSGFHVQPTDSCQPVYCYPVSQHRLLSRHSFLLSLFSTGRMLPYAAYKYVQKKKQQSQREMDEALGSLTSNLSRSLIPDTVSLFIEFVISFKMFSGCLAHFRCSSSAMRDTERPDSRQFDNLREGTSIFE